MSSGPTPNECSRNRSSRGRLPIPAGGPRSRIRTRHGYDRCWRASEWVHDEPVAVIDLLPRRTLAAGAIIRWHLVGRWLGEIASGHTGTRWLDVGCGGGEYVFRIARRFPRASL